MREAAQISCKFIRIGCAFKKRDMRGAIMGKVFPASMGSGLPKAVKKDSPLTNCGIRIADWGF